MDIDNEVRRLKETGKIDGIHGASRVGSIVDVYNEAVRFKREKRYSADIEDRNKYFLPLLKRAAEELKSGS